MREFTVVGFYPETNQRFMETFESETAMAAELEALAAYDGLYVCGIIAGQHDAADMDRKRVANVDGELDEGVRIE